MLTLGFMKIMKKRIKFALLVPMMFFLLFNSSRTVSSSFICCAKRYYNFHNYLLQIKSWGIC